MLFPIAVGLPWSSGTRASSHKQSQAYTFIAEEADASCEVMAGIILVDFVHHVCYLIPMHHTASHYLYSSNQHIIPYKLCRLCKHSMPFGGLNTDTGNGIFMSSKLCRWFQVVVGNREYHSDLFVLDHYGFDVILSMDWLSASHVGIDHHRRACVLDFGVLWEEYHYMAEFVMIKTIKPTFSNAIWGCGDGRI